MTKDFYISQLKEKVNASSDEINFFVAMKLLLAYNKRILEKDKQEEFDKKSQELFVSLLKEKPQAVYDSKTRAEVLKEVFSLCDGDVQKAYSLAKKEDDALYNVHTLITGCEETLAKGFVKEARWLGEYSLENQDMLDEFKKSIVDFELYSRVLCDENMFKMFYSKAKINDKTGNLTEEKFRQTLENLHNSNCETFSKKSNKYIPRVVEELVRDDVRILSNQEINKK